MLITCVFHFIFAVITTINLASKMYPFIPFYNKDFNSKLQILDQEMLEYKLQWVLNRLRQSRPQKPPQNIFVIRDGISEGMIPNASSNYMHIPITQ